jgi:CheY-like chemotaxis protein
MNNLPILVAEDNEDDAFLLRRAFGKAQFSNPLHLVPDGVEAMAYLKGTGQYADRAKFPFPALVLLDIKMPRMNGLETLAAIRKDPELKRLVVIFLSSSDQEQDINEAFDLRANSYLVKPNSAERMINILQKLREYWIGLNQFPNFLLPAAGTV